MKKSYSNYDKEIKVGTKVKWVTHGTTYTGIIIYEFKRINKGNFAVIPDRCNRYDNHRPTLYFEPNALEVNYDN